MSMLSSSSLISDALRGAETEQIEKVVLQRGRAPLWYHLDGGYHYRCDRVAESYRCIGDRVRKMMPLAQAEPVDASFPSNTQHGYPDYENTERSLLLHGAMAAAPSVEMSLDRARRAAEWLGTPIPEPSSIVFSRTGFNRKPIRLWKPDGPRIVSESGRTSVICKTRVVWGYMAFLNGRLITPAEHLKTALTMAFPEMLTRKGPDNDCRLFFAQIEKARSFWTKRLGRSVTFSIYEEDKSGFDQHVSYESQLALLDEVYSTAGPKAVADYRLSLHLPVVTPGLVNPDGLRMHTKRGMTTSGIRTTANPDGNTHSLAIRGDGILRSYSGQFDSIDDVWTASDEGAFPCLNLGDDALHAHVDGLFDPAEYEEAAREIGHVLTFVPDGRTFLMNWLESEDTWFALASRCFMQTLFREHGVESRTIELLGAGARWERCLRHPLVERAYDTTVRGTWMERFSLGELISTYNSPRFQAQVQLELARLGGKRSRDFLLSLTSGIGASVLPADSPLRLLDAGSRKFPFHGIQLNEDQFNDIMFRAFPTPRF